jgi:hypothetical protein
MVSFAVGDVLTVTADFCTSIRPECKISSFNKGELVFVIGYNVDDIGLPTVIFLTSDGIKEIYDGIIKVIMI